MEERLAEHKVVMENREKVMVTAVEDVESFDEEKIVIHTDMGIMTVIGADFRISRLNVEEGQVLIEGEVDEIHYSDKGSGTKEQGGLLSRLFR